MSNMFNNNTLMTTIIFGDEFDTSNAEQFTAMFNNCTTLKHLT